MPAAVHLICLLPMPSLKPCFSTKYLEIICLVRDSMCSKILLSKIFGKEEGKALCINSKMASGLKDKKKYNGFQNPRQFSDEFWTCRMCRACISAIGEHRDHALTLEGKAQLCKLSDTLDAV